jgi:Putative citrate transport
MYWCSPYSWLPPANSFATSRIGSHEKPLASRCSPGVMIYAIAVERGFPMPSFFAFMAWSSVILLPVFAIVGWAYFG